ncbi:uncharacterized protein LOC132875032 [Neoarius graeffei]|uniref:uncharacterized protein LOC132875032 n=1 Tax=Neoarius graeffei TaxID=443677 RepID=UPI00298CFBBF|nr:uncharacterized protein LOC132875032 [Neoarius graeffei]XP_060767600.1 uncharacterized protein LOC132875032 [Neoarius graeffei]
MHINTWTPPVKQNNLASPPQTLSNMQFDPASQMGYYGLQQKSFDQQSVSLSNPQAFSQTISSSANLQSNQAPQMWSSGYKSHLPSVSPAFGRHYPPNIVPYASLQVGPLTANLDYDPQALNTTIQRNYKELDSMQNVSFTAPQFSVMPVPSNSSGVFENSYGMYDSVSPWQHPLNRQHHTTHQTAGESQQAALTARNSHAAPKINMNQEQMSVVGQHNETPRSVVHFPDASHVPVGSKFRIYSSHMSQSHVQNTLHQPSPWTTYKDRSKHSSSQTPPLPYSSRLKSAIQNQSNQRRDQALPNLTQDKIQSQTTPFSGYHSKTNFETFSAIQKNIQPQDLQSNNTMSGLTKNSQEITSFSTSNSQTSSPTSGSRSMKYSLLSLLLQKDNNQLSGLTSPSNSLGSQFAKRKRRYQQSTHDNTTGCITTGENYTQGSTKQGRKYKEPAKETSVSMGNETGTGRHLVKTQTSSQDEMTNWKKTNEEVQSCINPVDSLKLEISQLRRIQQISEAKAVVPPISKQASSHGYQNDVTTSTHDSLHLKTDTIKNPFEEHENMEETYVLNRTFKLIEDLPYVPSSSSLPRLGFDTSVNISERPVSENKPTSIFQSGDISQCKNGTVSTTQISHKHQDAIHVVGLTSKSSVKQNDDLFDLSTVPVVDYTLKDLKDLVSSLEVKPAERENLMIKDVVKCIIELYYDGNKQNFINLVSLKELFKILSSELCVKEMHALVLQYLLPKHLKMFENCFQILINETTIPSEDFRSSWLNVDGQPADVEKVLAEPFSDYNLTWCKKDSQSVSESVVSGVDSLSQIGTHNAENLDVNARKNIPKTTVGYIPEGICHSDPEHSTAIFATTDCTTDTGILEKGCESKPPSELSRIQTESKKQCNQQLHDEVDMVKENKRAFTEPSLTCSSDKYVPNNSDVFEKTDSSDNEDSTSDFPNIILLSSEETRKLFSECSECDQKREPHRICQEKRKDLVTLSVKNKSDSVKVKPLDDFKFTCPHVTGLACVSDFFCPICWNETPLLDIDQDETLLTPMEVEHNIDYQRRSCSPQSGKPVKYPSAPICLESSSIINSIISTSKSDGCDVTRDPKLGDWTQSSSPLPARELHHGIAGTKNSSMTKPVAEDRQKITSSANTDLTKEDAYSPSGAKILPGMVSLSRNLNCKHVKSPKTNVVPDADDILFRTPKVSGTPKCKNAVPHKQKEAIIKEIGHDGQSKEAKTFKFELYGSKSSDSSCHNQEKSPSTPVYLTVSSSPNTEKSYTDEPSARQKVYRQWSTTFIHPQKSSSPYKTSQKHMEDQLKSKLETLKIALEDRIMALSQMQSTK